MGDFRNKIMTLLHKCSIAHLRKPRNEKEDSYWNPHEHHGSRGQKSGQIHGRNTFALNEYAIGAILFNKKCLHNQIFDFWKTNNIEEKDRKILSRSCRMSADAPTDWLAGDIGIVLFLRVFPSMSAPARAFRTGHHHASPSLDAPQWSYSMFWCLSCCDMATTCATTVTPRWGDDRQETEAARLCRL